MSAITAAFVAGCLLGLMLRRGVAPGGANGGVWYPPATTEPPPPPAAPPGYPLTPAGMLAVHIPNPKDHRSLAEIEAGVSHA